MESPHPFRPADRGASIAKRLRAFPFFDRLGDSALETLARSTRIARFDDPHVLVNPRDEVVVLPLVERGAIRVHRADPDRELTLYTVQPGESCVLALAGALRGTRYAASAVAAAGTEVLLVDAEVVRELFSREPDLQVFVLDLFSARLFDLMQLVREVAFDRLDVRLARFLLAEAGAARGIVRPIELSHAEIAARLGSAREVVSRTLDRMKQDGFVRMERGRVYVENAAGLRERYGA